MEKFAKTCANEQHEKWKSLAPVLVNLNGKVGERNVFFKAFKQKDAKRPRDSFCTDCLKKYWEKRQYTSKLPKNYESLTSYSVVSSLLFAFFIKII